MLQDKFTRLQEVLSRTFLKSCSLDAHVNSSVTHSEAQRTWQNSVELCRSFYLDPMIKILTNPSVAVSLSRQNFRSSVECSRAPEQYKRRASLPCNATITFLLANCTLDASQLSYHFSLKQDAHPLLKIKKSNPLIISRQKYIPVYFISSSLHLFY